MSNFKRLAVSNFGDIIKENKNGKELVFKCPKCGRNKLYFNNNNAVFHCFRCDYKGRLKNDKYSIKDLKNDFNSKQNIKDTENILYSKHNSYYFESKLKIYLINDKTDLTDYQIDMLISRGLTMEDINYYNIFGKKGSSRIQIPNYMDKFNKFTDIICAWEPDKNKITKNNPKYLNTSKSDKSKTVFNIFNIEDNIDKIIICEGIFNAITAGKNAVASYGCNISDYQVAWILSKNPKSILIAYDSDKPGVLGSINLINKLKNASYNGLVEYILLPNNIDINDLGHDNFIDYYKNNKVKIDLDNALKRKLPQLLFNSRLK